MECQAVTRAGRVCGAHALRDGDYCYMHAPEKSAERSSARRLGGLRRSAHTGDVSALPLTVRAVGDVLEVLDYTLAELAALSNGVARNRGLIALCGEYIKALEIGEIERRLQALEEMRDAYRE
jgi:hypothetical protein